MKDKEIAKIDNKISFNSFIKYTEKNLLLIILTFILLFVTHGYLMFNNNIGIDTDNFLILPEGNHNWLQIGRYGLVIEKYLLNLESFNIFYAETLFMIFMTLFCVLTYYMINVLSGKDFKFLNLLIPLIGLTNPTFAEQFVFLLQIAQISLTLFLTVLATLCVYKWIIDKKWVYGIINVALLVLIFGTYQSFVVVYIAFCLFAFILMCENDEFEFKNNKDYWIQILKILSTFFISFVLYQIILKSMNVDMTYLNQSNAWLRNPPIECVKNVYRNFRQMIKAEGHYYNFGLPIGLIYLIILGIINSIKTKKKINVFNKLVYFAVYCAFAITPLLLTIYLGNPPPLRTQFYLPIIEALVLMIMGYSMMKIPKINVLCSCVFFVIIMLVYSDQASITSKLYYGDHQTRVNDMQIAYQLLYDMRKAGIKEHESIYIYGHFDDRINKSAMTGEMIGYSLFENGYGMQPYFWYSTESVLKLFKSLGYYYNMIPIEYGEDAYNQAKDMEDIWPKENAIKWVEPGYWIIKIAEK